MAKQAKTPACPECGGTMRQERHDDVLTYKGQTRAIKTLGWWCAKCGESILTGAPLKAHSKAFLELKAQVDEVMSPAQVASVRAKLRPSERKKEAPR